MRPDVSDADFVVDDEDHTTRSAILPDITHNVWGGLRGQSYIVLWLAILPMSGARRVIGGGSLVSDKVQ